MGTFLVLLNESSYRNREQIGARVCTKLKIEKQGVGDVVCMMAVVKLQPDERSKNEQAHDYQIDRRCRGYIAVRTGALRNSIDSAYS